MKIFKKTDSQVEIRRSMSMSDGSDDEDTAGQDDSQEEASPRTSSMKSQSMSRAPRENSAASLGSQGDVMRGDSIVLEAEIEKRIQALEEKDREMKANVEVVQLENRIVVLEAAENRRRIQATQQGSTALAKDVEAVRSGWAGEVEKTSSPVVEKDRKAMSAHQISPETVEKVSDIAHAMAVQFGDKAKGGTDEDLRFLNLIAKTQHLDDAIAQLREKMELQVMRLEATLNHQERQICLALEQRCTAMEDRLQESVQSMHHQTLQMVECHLEMETTKNTCCSPASGASSDGHASSVEELAQSMLPEATNMLSDDDDEAGPTRHTARIHEGLNDMLKGARTIAVWHPFADGERRDTERQERRSDSESSLRVKGSGARGSSAAISSNVRGRRPLR